MHKGVVPSTNKCQPPFLRPSSYSAHFNWVTKIDNLMQNAQCNKDMDDEKRLYRAVHVSPLRM